MNDKRRKVLNQVMKTIEIEAAFECPFTFEGPGFRTANGTCISGEGMCSLLSHETAYPIECKGLENKGCPFSKNPLILVKVKGREDE